MTAVQDFAASPALIGLDWGTTALRAYLFDTHGNVMATRESGDGIMRLPQPGGFDAAFDAVCGEWLALAPTVPVIAAGGMVDGRTMAAAFMLGAEGVQMGTRMVSSAESPVHMNWKNAILSAQETDTVFLNRFGPGPALRALRTEKTTRIEKEPPANVMSEFGHALDLYFGGDMEASIALSGQVCGRIHEIKPVKQVIEETVAEFHATIGKMAKAYA